MSILPLCALAGGRLVPPSLLRDVPVDSSPNIGPFANGILLPTLASLSYRRDRLIQTVVCSPNVMMDAVEKTLGKSGVRHSKYEFSPVTMCVRVGCSPGHRFSC